MKPRRHTLLLITGALFLSCSKEKLKEPTGKAPTSSSGRNGDDKGDTGKDAEAITANDSTTDTSTSETSTSNGMSGAGGTDSQMGKGGGGESKDPQPFVGMRIGTNFWNIGWGIWEQVFKADANFEADSNPWNEAFLNELKPYGVLRFMDWSVTNNSKEATWASRSSPDERPTPDRPIPWEWMIDLCNRLDKDMWLNVPHLADDGYSEQLAQLVEANLETQLRVYVEWSNETWNAGFAQQQYAQSQGQELGFSDPAGDYHVYSAVRVFEQFEKVFGAKSPRLVRVIAGQSVNTWLTQQQLKALSDTKVNPHAIRPHAYAIAPYFGHSVNGNDANAMEQLRASIDEETKNVIAQAALVKAAGLSLVAYEGGQHVTTGAHLASANPEMYNLYAVYLTALKPHLDVFVHYLHNGQWADGGAWGAESHVGQPLQDAHKLRAIYDFISANKTSK